MTIPYADWEAIGDPADRVIALWGDSTSEFDDGGTAPPWPRMLRDKLAARWGPLSGTGIRGCWTDEWSFTTGGGNDWTLSTDTDAFDVGFIYGATAGTRVMVANGSGKVATWTKPAWFTATITTVRLWVVDGPASGNFAYRVNGGAWTNVAGTWTQDDDLKYIDITANPSSTFEVRGANAAGTAVTVYLAGVEMRTGGTGVTFHDLSASSEGIYSTTGFDTRRWIDKVQPDLLFVMFTNDLLTFAWTVNQTTPYIANRLNETVERVADNGGLCVPVVFWGQSRDGADAARYAEWVDYHQDAADLAGVDLVDLYSTFGDYATVNALGWMATELHPSDRGSAKLAEIFYALLARGTGNPRVRV